MSPFTRSRDDSLLLPDDEQPDTPTTFKVVLILAIVAFVVGCIPGLVVAFSINDNLKAQSNQIQAQVTTLCTSRRESILASNIRLESTNKNLRSDLTLLKASLRLSKNQPNVSLEGLATLIDSINSKKELIKKNVPTPVPTCKK